MVGDGGNLAKRVSEEYQSKAKIVRNFLESKGYSEIGDIEEESLGRFTYSAEIDGMPYFIKISAIKDSNDEGSKRQRAIENEISALTELWKRYPEGETKSFILPPGPEIIFDEEYKGLRLGGYARFWIDGKVLGDEFRSGSQEITMWIDRFVNLSSEVDSFPRLDLPRTRDKEKVDFERVIVRNARYWGDKLREQLSSLSESGKLGQGESEEMSESVSKIVKSLAEFFSGRKIVRGSSLKEMTPDNVVFDSLSDPNKAKPYFVNFGYFCQSYPRYYDVARLYGWVCAVLGEQEAALVYWGKASERFAVDEREYLEALTNYLTLGSICDYLSQEEMELKVGPEIFMEV